MFNNIPCAIDGSGHSLRSATRACEMAKQSNGSLTLITATRPFKGSPETREYLESSLPGPVAHEVSSLAPLLGHPGALTAESGRRRGRAVASSNA